MSLMLQNQNIETGKLEKKDDFIIEGDHQIPSFNSLKAAYEATGDTKISFKNQFLWPKPALIHKEKDTKINLRQLVSTKDEIATVNIFNRGIFPVQNIRKKKIIAQSEHKEKAKIDLISLSSKKPVENPGFYKMLKPVPSVNLRETEMFAIKKINKHIQIDPASTNKVESCDLYIGFLIAFLIFLAYLQMFFRRQIAGIVKATFNHIRATKIYSEKNLLMGRVSFMMNILFILTSSLYLVYLTDYLGISLIRFSKLKTFIIYTTAIALAYFIKWIWGGLLAHLLQIKAENASYFYHSFLFNKTLTIISLPIILLTPFLDPNWIPYTLKSVVLLLIISYLLRYVRYFVMSIQRNISLFYLFLYLCALEIVPIFVMAKIVSNWLGTPLF